MADYRKIVQDEQKMKPRLYKYPNPNESDAVFDFEDLEEEAMLVLCIRAQIGVPGHEHDQNKVFVWKGGMFEEDDSELISQQEFVARTME